MGDAVSERKIGRMKVGNAWSEDTSRFCLRQMAGYETDEPATTEKVEALLDDRVDHETGRSIGRSCNIGGCTLRIMEATELGRKVTGRCRAASYCLDEAFRAVGDAPTTAEGKELYRDIIGSLDGQGGGNFCPRLECGLSAGVSEDMVPGTAGVCVEEPRRAQPRLFDVE